MNNHFLILTAPPASGKTHLITKFIEQFNDIPLVISPLRALANECVTKWGSSCVVMTPEEWLRKKVRHSVVILDEFHLFYYWGDTFRPQMWEAFFEMVETADLVIALTATLTQEMITEIEHFSCHFETLTWVDHGNQQLKNKPKKYLKAQNRKWLEDFILTADHGKGVNLLFCAYRTEVLHWEKLLSQKGFEVWTCLGGEAASFSSKTLGQAPPDFIVATTVLSHGVNLPNISRIFLLYQIKNLDFWIQMVARGGRRGEDFEVFALEDPVGLKLNRVLNFLAIQRLSLKMKFTQSLKQIEEWFLKA